MTRVLRRGQWLGIENRIAEMSWTSRDGWVARDSTGCDYYERAGRMAHHPEGLPTAEVPRSCGPDDITPWPPDPIEAADRLAVLEAALAEAVLVFSQVARSEDVPPIIRSNASTWLRRAAAGEQDTP